MEILIFENESVGAGKYGNYGLDANLLCVSDILFVAMQRQSFWREKVCVSHGKSIGNALQKHGYCLVKA